MVLICMQKAIIKKSDARVKAPKGTTVEKMHKEEKIEGEREGKKRKDAPIGGGTSPGPIRRDRRALVITNPPVTTYTPMGYSFPRANLNQISHA